MWAPLGIVAAACVAYYNTFQGVFLFDDFERIVNNPWVRDLWPPWRAMSHTTRPLVQLTLAVNHAWSGLDVWSYHAVNLLIHALAGLALFGVTRRTLATPGMPERIRSAAGGLGFTAALLWVVHPLQTESVTYIIQRAESLSSLFYLLTLYCAIRGASSARPRRWEAAAIAACALGIASKPLIATAPLMMAAYDRTFLYPSFRALWPRRRLLYAGLLATLGLLPWLFASGPLEWRGSAGLGVAGIGPLDYAMTQPAVLLHYLRLCLWPDALVLDYNWPIVRSPGAAIVPGLAVAALLALTAFLCLRRNRLGFLGVWFFLILAPTSSLIPIADPAFEHRLYLPLAAFTTLATLAGYEALHRLSGRLAWPAAVTRAVAVALVVALAGAWTARSIRRNADYRSIEAMWEDTAAKRPQNPRAHASLAFARLAAGRMDEAFSHFNQAERLDPNYALAQFGLGYVLSLLGRFQEAEPHARAAVRLAPTKGEAQFLLGSVLMQNGALEEAERYLLEAVKFEPERSSAHLNLGAVLERTGRLEEALPRYAEAVRLHPVDPNTQRSLGLALARAGRTDEARVALEAALALRPDDVSVRQALEALGPPTR